MLSDDELRAEMAYWSEETAVHRIARELLAAREVVKAARGLVGDFYPMEVEERPLWKALNAFDEATR